MPTKNARTFRLSSLTERQLDALSAQWGTSLTETLTLIIDRAWQHDAAAAEPTPAAAIQLWQHRTAGEQYVVCVDAGHVVGAVGPIYQPERDAQLLAAHTRDWEWDAELADDIANRDDEYRCVWPYESA